MSRRRARGGAGTQVAALVLLLAGQQRTAAGWRTSGVLPAESRWMVYVGKFCFDFKRGDDEEAGKFEFWLEGKVVAGPQDTALESREGPPCWGPCETQGNLYLMVFDDEEDHWMQAHRRWSSLTCEEMLSYSSFAMPLTALDGPFNRTVYVHEKIRPRFWYFTFAACGVTIVEPVRYSIHTENILQGLQSEFGLDERGSLQLQLVSLVLFLGMSLTMREVARRATGAEALRSRPLLRLLIGSAFCSAIGAACLVLHFLFYTFNGYGVALLEVLGQVWICGAKAMLTLLQLLTAKGWALFYSPEEMIQRRVMICLIGGIILTSIACEIHAEYFHDWSTSLYLYESWPGMVILLLNVILFSEAWRSMRETYRHETSEEVRVFYAVISAASLLYFLTLPTMCVLAAAFAPWVRAKYISRAEVASRFFATALLGYCLRPSRLDAMVNARLEEGLETVGEPREDLQVAEQDSDRTPEADQDRDRERRVEGYKEDDMSQRLVAGGGSGKPSAGPAE